MRHCIPYSLLNEVLQEALSVTFNSTTEYEALNEALHIIVTT